MLNRFIEVTRRLWRLLIRIALAVARRFIGPRRKGEDSDDNANGAIASQSSFIPVVGASETLGSLRTGQDRLNESKAIGKDNEESAFHVVITTLSKFEDSEGDERKVITDKTVGQDSFDETISSKQHSQAEVDPVVFQEEKSSTLENYKENNDLLINIAGFEEKELAVESRGEKTASVTDDVSFVPTEPRFQDENHFPMLNINELGLLQNSATTNQFLDRPSEEENVHIATDCGNIEENSYTGDGKMEESHADKISVKCQNQMMNQKNDAMNSLGSPGKTNPTDKKLITCQENATTVIESKPREELSGQAAMCTSEWESHLSSIITADNVDHTISNSPSKTVDTIRKDPENYTPEFARNLEHSDELLGTNSPTCGVKTERYSARIADSLDKLGEGSRKYLTPISSTDYQCTPDSKSLFRNKLDFSETNSPSSNDNAPNFRRLHSLNTPIIVDTRPISARIESALKHEAARNRTAKIQAKGKGRYIVKKLNLHRGEAKQSTKQLQQEVQENLYHKTSDQNLQKHNCFSDPLPYSRLTSNHNGSVWKKKRRLVYG